MGYDRHHAIVVTSFDPPELEKAREIAIEDGAKVTEIVPGNVSFWSTFVVVPDGSAEGWSDSTEGDQRRAHIVDYLRSRAFNDGSSLLSWVEVQFGDDNGETRVIADSDEHYREQA